MLPWAKPTPYLSGGWFRYSLSQSQETILKRDCSLVIVDDGMNLVCHCGAPQIVRQLVFNFS
jgi:hypothetical protein